MSEQITEQDLHRFADLINSSDSGELSDAVVENGVLCAKVNAGHLIGAREAAALAVEEAALMFEASNFSHMPDGTEGHYQQTHVRNATQRLLRQRADDIRNGAAT